jgi:hypothetical protein
VAMCFAISVCAFCNTLIVVIRKFFTKALNLNLGTNVIRPTKLNQAL